MKIHRITQTLYLGRYPAAEEQPFLENAGITHVLNVCDSASELTHSDALREIAWHPIKDNVIIPDSIALNALDALHRMVCLPASRVYVHCLAGQQRGPTMLWLYLVACGLDRREAAQRIVAQSPDTMPGHAQIVDARLVGMVEEYGKAAFQPHPRGEAIGWIGVH